MTGAPDVRPRLSLATIAYIAPLYFITVGLLHLWGYWGTFHINILEHAGLSDVVRASAQPVASAFVFWIVGSLIGSLIGHRNSAEQARSGDRVQAKRKAVRVFRLRYLIYALGILPMCIGAYVTSTALFWLAAPMIAVAISPRIVPYSLLEEVLPSRGLRWMLISLIVALPLFAFAQGKIRADYVKSGREYLYLQSIWPGVKNEHTTIENSPRLLGRASSHLFFLLPVNGDIAVTSTTAEPTYHLQRFKDDTHVAERVKSLVATIRAWGGAE